MATGKWSELSPRTRQLILTAAAVEGALKVAALVDLKRRPASQVRGSKWVWATALVLVNSAGALPVAYFVLGRQPSSGSAG